MTDCLNFEQQISALIDGELPEAERQVLEAHLETCPDCMETYHMFSDISAAMHDISYEVPFDLKDRVLEQIEEEKITPIAEGARRWSWKRYAAMAAAFADNFWYEEKDAAGNVIDSHYDAFYPRAYNMGNGTSGFNLLTNDRYLLNMAYLRLKNVTLGYSFPVKWIRKVNMERARIYVSLENFLTFDHLKGMPVDPEVVAGTSSLLSSGYNASRAAVGAPAMRTASFGLQLTF